MPEETSFFSVDSPDISVSAIKKAEDDNSAIVRLYETGRGETNVNLNSWFNVRNAELTDMLEYNGKSTDIQFKNSTLKGWQSFHRNY